MPGENRPLSELKIARGRRFNSCAKSEVRTLDKGKYRTVLKQKNRFNVQIQFNPRRQRGFGLT